MTVTLTIDFPCGHKVGPVCSTCSAARIAELAALVEAKDREISRQEQRLLTQTERVSALEKALAERSDLYETLYLDREKLRSQLATEDDISTIAIQERDSHEDYLNRIADALGDESEWSNLNHRGDRALELIEMLQTRQETQTSGSSEKSSGNTGGAAGCTGEVEYRAEQSVPEVVGSSPTPRTLSHAKGCSNPKCDGRCYLFAERTQQDSTGDVLRTQAPIASDIGREGVPNTVDSGRAGAESGSRPQVTPSPETTVQGCARCSNRSTFEIRTNLAYGLVLGEKKFADSVEHLCERCFKSECNLMSQQWMQEANRKLKATAQVCPRCGSSEYGPGYGKCGPEGCQNV